VHKIGLGESGKGGGGHEQSFGFLGCMSGHILIMQATGSTGLGLGLYSRSGTQSQGGVIFYPTGHPFMHTATGSTIMIGSGFKISGGVIVGGAGP